MIALDLVESGRLVEESLGETKADPDLVEGLYLETGGNPLFILESLRAWHENTLEGLGHERLERKLTLPPTSGVTSVISRRLQSLSAQAKAVLEATAVLGGQARSRFVAIDDRPADGDHRASRGRSGAQRSAAREHDRLRSAPRPAPPGGAGRDRRRDVARRSMSGPPMRSRPEQPDLVEDLAYHFAASQVADKAYRYSLLSRQESGRPRCLRHCRATVRKRCPLGSRR